MKKHIYLSAMLGAVAMFCGAFAQIQNDESSTPVESKSGQIESFIENDHGDIDGIQLENGLLVHFPPHVGEKIQNSFEKGDVIIVKGQPHTTPKGKNVFEATEIRSEKEVVSIEKPKHPPRKKPPFALESQLEKTGTVKEFHTNPHGDIDGFTLSDGTEVKFPPHLGERLSKLVAVDQQVTVKGRQHVTPHGDTHFHADQIVNEATQESLLREGPHPGARPHHEPTHSEIMDELRAIRRILEERN